METRRQIYSLVFRDNENCIVALSDRLKIVPVDHTNAGRAVHDTRIPTHFTLEDTTCYPPRDTALLRSCRQVYSEAIDLLYSTTIFLIRDMGVLLSFLAFIPQHCNNAISTLRIYLHRVNAIEAQDSDTSAVQYQCTKDWNLFWYTILRLQGLKDLEISVLYDWRGPEPPSGFGKIEELMLSPLHHFRGLRRFVVRLMRAHWDQGPYDTRIEIQPEPETVGLMKIMEANGRRSRITSET